MKLDTSKITDCVAIHCPKKEYVKPLFEALDLPESAIIKLEEYWEINEGNTHFLKDFDDIPPFYIAESKNWNFSHKDWCIKNGYTIIPFTDLIIPEESNLIKALHAVGVGDWLQEGVKFNWRGCVYCIENGQIISDKTGLITDHLLSIINNPELIKPLPKWTPEEQEMAKKDSFRFKYVARDRDNLLCLYVEEPFYDDIVACYCESKNDENSITITETDYPSLGCDECVKLGDIANG